MNFLSQFVTTQKIKVIIFCITTSEKKKEARIKSSQLLALKTLVLVLSSKLSKVTLGWYYQQPPTIGNMFEL